jgi:8-oxo-dGTP diphosphatase
MVNSKPESRLIKAAGAVAWRPGPEGEPEILLVHRKKYDDWSLPKGKLDSGELLPVTAVREVNEEGGAQIALGRRLRSVRYLVGGRPKRVHYWAARVTATDKDAVPNSEVDRVAWVSHDRALEQVSYSHDVTILEDFATTGTDTFPIILLRHAKAEGKSGWKRDDLSRPLDDTGRADAKALADLLACFAPAPRLVSSPATRCVDTLRPFAQLSGVPVHEVPALYFHHKDGGTNVAGPTTLIAAAIEAGEPTVICAHRENIPDLQAAALAALDLSDAKTGIRNGAESPSTPFPDEFTLPRDWPTPLTTASFWVLHLTRGTPDPANAAEDRDSAKAPGADPARLGTSHPAAAAQAAETGTTGGIRLALRQRLSAVRLRWSSAHTGSRTRSEPAAESPVPEQALPPVTLVAIDRYDTAEP